VRANVASALVALLLPAFGCGSAGEKGGAPSATGGCDPSNLSSGACAVVRELALPATLPPARGNKYGDDEDAAKLGFGLFFDADVGHGVGCVTCHAPESAFTDRRPVSVGKGTGNRNAPTVFNAARLSVIFWDGRADSVWSQPLFAIENPLEMASSRLELAHLIDSDPTLHAGYEKVFGPVPDMSAWPGVGKPGDAAFDSLPDGTQTEVNRVAANVGKSLEAYMRKNSSGPSAFDQFLNGDTTSFIPEAQRGIRVFVDAGCIDCHKGPMLTDETFHDVGFPSPPGAAVDRGRVDGISVLEANPFNLAGLYADPDSSTGPIVVESAKDGEFRTPSLRSVARTAPYGHDGVFDTLDDVLAVHASHVSDEDRGALITFLLGLNGETPPLPWSNWPSPQ
jgi:cytochrome c peroxidase